MIDVQRSARRQRRRADARSPREQIDLYGCAADRADRRRGRRRGHRPGREAGPRTRRRATWPSSAATSSTPRVFEVLRQHRARPRRRDPADRRAARRSPSAATTARCTACVFRGRRYDTGDRLRLPARRSSGSPPSARTSARTSGPGCASSSTGLPPESGEAGVMSRSTSTSTDVLDAASSRSRRSTCSCSTRTAASWPRTSSPHVDLPPLRQLVDGRLRRARRRRRDAPDERPGRSCRSSATSPPGRGLPRRRQPGTSARIMTGAPMPAGADAVVPVEWTDGGIAAVHDPARRPRSGQHVRRRRRGRAAGRRRCSTRGHPRSARAQIGLLAAVGRDRVVVRPRPRVVVALHRQRAGRARRSSSVRPDPRLQRYMLTAAAREAGAVAYRVGHGARRRRAR